MALATILETLDDVPEALHAEYREQEIPNVGKRFVLDLVGVDTHPVVRNLKTAHDRVKQERDRLRTDLEGSAARLAGLPDDFDPAEYLRLKQAEADGKGGKIDERLEAQRRDLDRKREEAERRLNDEIKTREERIAFLDSNVNRITIDDGLTRSLIEAGVSKEYLGAAKALLKEKGVIKLVEEDGVFKAIADTDTLGEVPLPQFVTEWTTGEEGRAFVPKPTGGDAKGGNGKTLGENPWDTQGGKVRPNLTKQNELVATQPERARQLAKAAGVTPTW